MITLLSLTLAAIAVFTAYNAIAIKLFGIPSSLSNTFYYFNNKWKNGGWIFTAMMWIVCGLLIVPWIEVNQKISSWSQYLTILPFATIACLLFVATAPNFRDEELPNKVHMTCAKLAAVFALLWICIVCWKIIYIIPIIILICGGIAHWTKTAKSGRDWWLEMCVFISTFVTIIIKLLINL